MATSLPYFDIFVDVMTVKEELYYSDIDALCNELSRFLGKSPEEWRLKFDDARSRNNRYLNIAKNLSKDQLTKLKGFPIFREGRYKGGLMYETKSSREKPYKQLASRTIGLDRKNASQIGLEKSFNKVLSGEKQKILMQRYPGDQWLPVFDPAETEQERGADIVTTLDMDYQDIVHDELQKVVRKYRAEAGTAILMEVETGAIKAISNLGKIGDDQYSENYNYAMARLSEPGSTFKLVSALAILESGKIDLDTKIALSKGRKKFYDRWMKDSENHGLEAASFQEAFKISSNVGLANAAFAVFGKSRDSWLEFYEALKKLGVMKSTGIEINGEPEPFFKNPAKGNTDKRGVWSGTTVPWMAHGYELHMTPLQILNVYNAVANDGMMMKPYLVKEIIEPGEKPKKISPVIVNAEIADEQVILKAQKLLKGVAESGTAKKFRITNTSFAGKTGTTRINYWKQSIDKEYNASFAGYFPAEDPKYSLIVVIYNPKGAYYGSQVAGPVFSEIVQRISGMEHRVLPEYIEGTRKVVRAHSGYKSDYTKLLEFIGLDYKNHARSNWVDMNPEEDELRLEVKKIKTKTIPDVIGMGLRDATYVLESLGLNVVQEGMGKVYKQSIRAGTDINGQTIKIYLR